MVRCGDKCVSEDGGIRTDSYLPFIFYVWAEQSIILGISQLCLVLGNSI